MNTTSAGNKSGRVERRFGLPELSQFSGTFKKDVKQWVRDRQALVSPMLLPIVLMFIATVLFGFGGDQWNVGIVDKSRGAYSQSLTREFEQSHSNITPYFNIVTRDDSEAKKLVDEGRLHMVITIPPDFDELVAKGETPTLDTQTYNINTDMMKNARLRLDRVLQDWGETRGLSPISVTQATTRDQDIWRKSFIGGSAVILAVMVGAAMNTALIMAREWEHRTAKEIQLAPRARNGIILGKLAAGLLASVIAAGVALVFATTIFGLRIPLERVPILLVYSGLTALAFAGFGLAVGAWLKDYRAIQPLILVTLAGSFFAAGGFSSVPTLPPGVRVFDQYWPPSWVFETLSNYAYMETAPKIGESLLLLAPLAIVGVFVGWIVSRRQL